MTTRQRPSKAHRQARARAAREQRRTALAHLLARVDRDALTEQERPLLRAHIEAEQTDADQLRATAAGQQATIQRQAAQLDAAHDAIREAEQQRDRIRTEYERLLGRWRDTEQAAADYREQLHMYRVVEAQRQADRAAPATEHMGGNAEDCDACRQGPPPPYPWICPGRPSDRAARIRAFLDEQTAHLTTPLTQCPCNGVCHECDDSPCDACQPTPTTSTPEPRP